VIIDGKEATLKNTDRTAGGLRRRGVSYERVASRSLGLGRSPVRVVKIPVTDAAGAPARRCDVRLVRSVRDPSADHAWESEASEVTAVVILRDVTPSRVASFVQAATDGGGSISPELLDQLLPVGESEGSDPREPLLSEREQQVLRMLAEGETTRGIAERLSYSERTVKNIVRDLLVKLDCKTRAHAVALAMRQGVI
jgi:DNA-binding CsgD family transcriptional regulator